jgi:exopolysaccharide biosynthesis polyprenyl glycosylphosphotransferase
MHEPERAVGGQEHSGGTAEATGVEDSPDVCERVSGVSGGAGLATAYGASPARGGVLTAPPAVPRPPRAFPNQPGPVQDRALPVTGATPAPGRRARVARLLLLGDLLSAIVAAALAESRGSAAAHPAADVLIPLLAGPGLVAGLAVAGVYRRQIQGHGGEEFRRLAVAALAGLAAASTVALALDAEQARTLILFGLPLALTLCLLVHVGGRLILRALHRRGRFRQPVVVMGLERSVAELVRTAHRDRTSGVEVVAACVAKAHGDRIEGVPVLGSPADVLTVLDVARAEAVVLTAWSDVSQEELRRLSWDLEGSGVQLFVAPRLAEVATPRLRIRTVGGIPLLDVQEPEYTGVRRAVKTTLDYGLAATALILLSPVLLAVAIAVKLTSPGPVLFRQERVGRHGTTFVMHKFRSMYVDAEQRLAQLRHLNEGGGPLFKLRDDPRVTPVGGFLRRYSLDELPQLFDVLLGRMSVVGPRPPLPREVAEYEDDVRRRLLVKPGVTGLWQVSGRSDLSWEESVRLDLSYVENWFLGWDLSIIARTLSAVLARQGAY